MTGGVEARRDPTREEPMRLDGVEVKVSLDSDQTAEAVRALDLADVTPWKIFFVEDITTGLCSATPLLDQHLIVRARQKTKGKDDVTIKFRPGRRSQLTDSWLATSKTTDGELDSELKVEGGDVDALLTHDQTRLVRECAGTLVNLGALTMLPAVSAMRWPTFPAPGPSGSALDVRAERWTVHDLDFLELSIAVEVRAAQAAQTALIAFVERKGLQPNAGEAKTTQVLQRLVAEAAC